VTEKVRQLLREEGVQPINDFRTLAVEQLAKHLAAAAIGYEMGISFDTAMRKYIEPHSRVGEMWKVAAQFILDCQAADNSPTPEPELVGQSYQHGEWSPRPYVPGQPVPIHPEVRCPGCGYWGSALWSRKHPCSARPQTIS
jgi:hypothetical protein